MALLTLFICLIFAVLYRVGYLKPTYLHVNEHKILVTCPSSINLCSFSWILKRKSIAGLCLKKIYSASVYKLSVKEQEHSDKTISLLSQEALNVK